MQKAGTYFNKLLNLNPEQRAMTEITIYQNPNGYLLSMTDRDICYQYFVAGENPVKGAITIPFNGIYGIKGFDKISVGETSITVYGKENKTVEFSIAAIDERNFRCFATTSIEAFANSLNGCSCFSKKGFHQFNENLYVQFSANAMNLYSATDISIMRNRIDANCTVDYILGLNNSDISAIKGWLNYVNNPKNGTGEILYLSLHRNYLKLQTATCAMILQVSSQMGYKDIVNKFDKMLNYPYTKDPDYIDWDEVFPKTKEKDKEYIDVADGQMIRTWSKAFIEFAMLESYETYKLNTKYKAYMLEMDNGLMQSKILLMLKAE